MLDHEVRSPMYLDQFARVKRWYGRLKKINDGVQHDRSTDHYQDEVYAFFINCYHLKDWISKDLNCPLIFKSKVDGKDFIKNSVPLSICHDLAIGAKHLEITRPKNDDSTNIDKRLFSLNLGGQDDPNIAIRYRVISDGKSYDAFELATNCLCEWESVLSVT